MGNLLTLVPPKRIKRHVLSYDCGKSFATVVTVTGLDGVVRVVERGRVLTGAQVEAERRVERMGR